MGDWLVDWCLLYVFLAVCLFVYLFVCWSVGWLIEWLDDLLVDRLADRSVDWWVGELDVCQYFNYVNEVSHFFQLDINRLYQFLEETHIRRSVVFK